MVTPRPTHERVGKVGAPKREPAKHMGEPGAGRRSRPHRASSLGLGPTGWF